MGISNKRKQIFQQDPIETGKIVNDKVAQAKAEIDTETVTQLEQAASSSIEELLNTEVTIGPC